MGRATWSASIPAVPALAGFAFVGQWTVLDPVGIPIPGIGGLAFTPGAWVRLGVR